MRSMLVAMVLVLIPLLLGCSKEGGTGKVTAKQKEDQINQVMPVGKSPNLPAPDKAKAAPEAK
jgi:hypothetical protein